MCDTVFGAWMHSSSNTATGSSPPPIKRFASKWRADRPSYDPYTINWIGSTTGGHGRRRRRVGRTWGTCSPATTPRTPRRSGKGASAIPWGSADGKRMWAACPVVGATDPWAWRRLSPLSQLMTQPRPWPPRMTWPRPRPRLKQRRNLRSSWRSNQRRRRRRRPPQESYLPNSIIYPWATIRSRTTVGWIETCC